MHTSPSVKLSAHSVANVRPAARSRRKPTLAEDQARSGHARPRGDEYVLDVGHRVHRGAPQLPHTLRDPVHAVDVGLTDLTSVGVDGKPPAHLDRAVGDEVLRLTAAAESQLLQLNQGER